MYNSIVILLLTVSLIPIMLIPSIIPLVVRSLPLSWDAISLLPAPQMFPHLPPSPSQSLTQLYFTAKWKES